MGDKKKRKFTFMDVDKRQESSAKLLCCTKSSGSKEEEESKQREALQEKESKDKIREKKEAIIKKEEEKEQPKKTYFGKDDKKSQKTNVVDEEDKKTRKKDDDEKSMIKKFRKLVGKQPVEEDPSKKNVVDLPDTQFEYKPFYMKDQYERWKALYSDYIQCIRESRLAKHKMIGDINIIPNEKKCPCCRRVRMNISGENHIARCGHSKRNLIRRGRLKCRKGYVPRDSNPVGILYNTACAESFRLYIEKYMPPCCDSFLERVRSLKRSGFEEERIEEKHVARSVRDETYVPDREYIEKYVPSDEYAVGVLYNTQCSQNCHAGIGKYMPPCCDNLLERVRSLKQTEINNRPALRGRGNSLYPERKNQGCPYFNYKMKQRNRVGDDWNEGNSATVLKRENSKFRYENKDSPERVFKFYRKVETTEKVIKPDSG